MNLGKAVEMVPGESSFLFPALPFRFSSPFAFRRFPRVKVAEIQMERIAQGYRSFAQGLNA
jgi:hypothetical protein